jgi:hypothetical protein
LPRPPRALLPPLRDRLLVLRDDVDLAAPDERLEPVPDVLARDEPDFVEVLLLRAFDVPLLAREVPLDDLAAPLRDDDDLVERDDALELLPADEPDELRPLLEPELLLSLDHLPLITRCAASATASAMIEPSLVALDSTLPAARTAVSAASRPASRIFLRAAGLALIAAAAAARPAASISLLIAALASLSTVSLLELEDLDELDREDFLLGCLATCLLPRCPGKTLLSRSGSLMKSEPA